MKSSFEPVALPGAPGAAFVARSTTRGGEADPAALAAAAAAAAAREAAAAAAAHAEAIEALQRAVGQLDRTLEETRRVTREEQRRWLSDALELGFALARRVLERELRVDPEAFHPAIARAAELLPPGVPLEIALTPQVVEQVEAHASESLASIRASHDVRFVADASLGADEACVRADASRVDVGIEPMLALLREDLAAFADPEEMAEGEAT